MADGDEVPATDNVVRHAGSSKVVNGVAQGTAFLLRVAEPGLSVNWLEFALPGGSRVDQCRTVKTALVGTGRAVRQNDWFIVVPIQGITAITELAGTAVRFVSIHHPLPGNESHTEINGLPPAESLLAALAGAALADAVVEAPIRSSAL